MKKLILLTGLFYVLYITGCQKSQQIPAKVANKPAVTAVAAKPDTIPDKGVFKLQLGMDTINTDETLFVFNHTSTLDYVFNEDVPYLQGFGKVSLSSISRDGRFLVINGLPYTSGMAVGLNVNVKASGAYFLMLDYLSLIPSNIRIYLKDNLLKDSVDVRTTDYKFNIDKADTNSFGNKRFKLIIKDGGQAQQTASR